jgi:hypothetical protein
LAETVAITALRRASKSMPTRVEHARERHVERMSLPMTAWYSILPPWLDVHPSLTTE